MLKISSLREALSFLRGNILVLTLTGSLGMFSRSMVFPYASLYILALGGEPAQIGLVNALRPLAGLLVFPIGGYLADRTGRVRLIALGGYLSGLVILLEVLAPNWQVIALAGLLQGFVVFQFPAFSAIIADSLSPQKRGVGNATMNTISGTMAIFAPYLAGMVLDRYGDNVGMRILYGIMVVVYLADATINLRFLKETSAHSTARIALADLPRAFKDAYSGIPAMLNQLPPSLKALAVVIVLSFTCNAIAGPFWVVYAKEKIGLASTEWGLILLLETLLRNVFYIPAGVIVDRYGRTQFVVISLLLSLASMPLFIFAAGFFPALLARVIVAISNAFSIPASVALMADIVPRKMRGTVMSAIGQGGFMAGASSGGTGGPGMGFLVTIPVVLGSLMGGYLYTCNPIYPWLFVSIATLISAIIAACFVRDPKQAEI